MTCDVRQNLFGIQSVGICERTCARVLFLSLHIRAIDYSWDAHIFFLHFVFRLFHWNWARKYPAREKKSGKNWKFMANNNGDKRRCLNCYANVGRHENNKIKNVQRSENAFKRIDRSIFFVAQKIPIFLSASCITFSSSVAFFRHIPHSERKGERDTEHVYSNSCRRYHSLFVFVLVPLPHAWAFRFVFYFCTYTSVTHKPHAGLNNIHSRAQLLFSCFSAIRFWSLYEFSISSCSWPDICTMCHYIHREANVLNNETATTATTSNPEKKKKFKAKRSQKKQKREKRIYRVETTREVLCSHSLDDVCVFARSFEHVKRAKRIE